jgi:ribosome-binding protein aMBF1 (putative translation factor)
MEKSQKLSATRYVFPEKITPEYLSMRQKATGIKNIIGENIRKARLKRGMSQMDLAFKLGVDQNYISKIEGGKINITAESLFKVLSYLECYLAIIDKQDETPPVKLSPCMKSKNKTYIKRYFNQDYV